jgi:hypothetical protein
MAVQKLACKAVHTMYRHHLLIQMESVLPDTVTDRMHASFLCAWHYHSVQARKRMKRLLGWRRHAMGVVQANVGQKVMFLTLP